MNPQNWQPKDIFEQSCPHCGTAVEFWKDDVVRPCPGCGKKIVNRQVGSSCMAWCDHAAECIGSDDITRWKTENNREAPGKKSTDDADFPGKDT